MSSSSSDRRRSFWGAAGVSREKRRRRSVRELGRLQVEVLEIRLTPATSIWSGAVDGSWLNNGNWDVPPAAGNELVFPATATNKTNTNDLTAGTSFASLTIASSGYTISGNSIALTTTLEASQTAGTDTVNLPISLAGPTIVKVDNSGASLALGGVISGSQTLTKQGAGVLDLTAANTLSGATAVSAGELDVDGTLASSAVTVNSGATLGGSGTVKAITTNSGTVRPGTATTTATLTDTSDLTLGAGSSFVVALNGTTAGTDYTQLQVGGLVKLNGATLTPSLGFTPTGNAQFTIIHNTGGSAVNGTFANQAQGSTLTISGVTFKINYDSGTTHDVVLTRLDTSSTSVTTSDNTTTFGESVTLTATVSSTESTAIPTGIVTFFSGTTSLGTGTLNGSGVATLATKSIPAGTDSITAQYAGDGSFASSTSSPITQTVAQAGTTSALTVVPNTSVTGQSVTLTATVASVISGGGTPTGLVNFLNGTTSLGSSSLQSNGTATFVVSTLPTGSNSITASYAGDSNFLPSTSTAMSATVSDASTSTALSSSLNPAGEGQSVTFTATVTPVSPGGGTPGGVVEFFNGTTSLGTGTLSSGIARFSTSSLPLGANAITAKYDGGTGYITSTSPILTETISHPSSTALTTSDDTTTFGESVTLTATVTGTGSSNTPTGNVQFFNGTTSLGTSPLNGTGIATLATKTIPAGANSITARYAGDSTFVGSTSNAITQTVAKAGTTTTVAANPLTSIAGQSVTLTATVVSAITGGGVPTGSVNFFSGLIPLGNAAIDSSGVASFATTALAVGSDSITAQYVGDSNFTTSTSPAITATVSQANTTTTVTSSLNPAGQGATITFTATVAVNSPGSGTATGSVEFRNGTQSLGTGTLNGSGVATFSTSSLPLGANSITAVYAGDTRFITSTSAALTQTIEQASTTTLNSVPLTSVFGQSVTLTATVAPGSGGSGTPTGTVNFFSGALPLGNASLIGGVATLSTTSIPTGSASLTAQYLGDSTFAGSNSPAITQTVAKASSTTKLTASPNPAGTNQLVTLTATIAAVSPGSGTPTGSVLFLNGTTSLGTATLSGGIAVLATVSLAQGANSITAVYQADTNFQASTSQALTVTVKQSATATLKTSPSSSVFGQAVVLTATIAGPSGSPTPTGSVQFFSGSTSLGNGTLSNGIATLSTTALITGSNSLTVVYSGDGTYSTSTSTAITQNVAQASTSTSLTTAPNPSASGAGVTLTATVAAVSPGAGSPTGNVQFFAGTTSLGTTSLTNGVATLTVSSLSLGTSSITATYQGSTNFLTSTSNAVIQNVAQANTSVTLKVSKSTPVAGEAVIFTATVNPINGSGSPTGTVIFLANGNMIGSGTISNGQATLITSNLPLGSVSVTAMFQGASSFNPSTSSAVSMSVGNANELFLNQVYLDVFLHPADPDGLEFWNNMLLSGTPRADVVAKIQKEPAARVGQVQSIYLSVLQRPPTTAEVNRALRASRSGSQLVAQLAGSREFYLTRAGGTNTGYINVLYQSLLGKPAPVSAQVKLTRQLQHGVSRTTVALNLLNSPTGKAGEVDQLYLKLLGRPATAAEHARLDPVVNRKNGYSTVGFNILSSDEFYNKFSQF